MRHLSNFRDPAVWFEAMFDEMAAKTGTPKGKDIAEMLEAIREAEEDPVPVVPPPGGDRGGGIMALGGYHWCAGPKTGDYGRGSPNECMRCNPYSLSLQRFHMRGWQKGRGSNVIAHEELLRRMAAIGLDINKPKVPARRRPPPPLTSPRVPSGPAMGAWDTSSQQGGGTSTRPGKTKDRQ